jgi:peptide/nickel transport system permease protein
LALGFVAALNRGSLIDRMVIVLASSGIAIPSFFLALLLSYTFGTRLGWLPSSGMYDIQGGGGIVDLLRHLILPAIALGSIPLAIITRITRASVLDVTNEDYVRTARAKGLGERRINGRHVMRNAWLPVVTVLGLQVGGLLAGAVITETVFAWGGVGRYVVDAIGNRDYLVVQSTILIFALVFLVVNLLVDILYAVLNPRIRYA